MTVTNGELNVSVFPWLVPFFEPARYKGAHGGRGSSKSWGFAELAIIKHIGDPERSTVCVREFQKSLTYSVKRTIEHWIKRLGVEHLFDVQQSVIKDRRGGGVITFMGMQDHTAESIKSLEGFDCAWVEEAQSLSQKSLDLLRPTIRKPGSELWFTWNPRNETDPVDMLLRGNNPPPGSIVSEVNYTDNPEFPEELRREMEYDRGRDLDKYAHVWLGQYVKLSEARVFKNVRIEPVDTPSKPDFRFGADWGFSVDPTVLVRVFAIERTLYIDRERYAVGVETVDLPSMFMEIEHSEKWPMVGDSSRPETISHLRKHGFPKLTPSIKGAKSVEEGIAFLQGYDIVIDPDCKHTVAEFMAYAYKTSPDGRVLPVLQDADNHCIDAVRYALEGLRRAAVKPIPIVIPLPVASRW